MLFNNMLIAHMNVIYTDFSEAFDGVDHSVLLRYLDESGFDDTLLTWSYSYLTNRRQ